MIKLSSLISEAVDSDKLNKLLATKYNDAHQLNKSGAKLYRGAHSFSTGFIEISPTKRERKSVDFDNLYTVLLSNLPSWKGWPRRSFCIIFSNNYEVADGYGSVNTNVFPENGADIVVAPHADVVSQEAWKYIDSQLRLDIDDVSNGCYFIIQKIIRKGEGHDDTYPQDVMDFFKTMLHKDYGEFIKIMNSVATIENMKKYLFSDDNRLQDVRLAKYFAKTYNKHNGDWETFLNDLLDPIKNGYKLIKLKDLSTIKHKAEMWTDAECLLVEI